MSHVTESCWNNSYILFYSGRCLWKAENLGYYTEGTPTEVWVSAVCRKNKGPCMDWRQQENCCGWRRKGKVSNSFVFVCVYTYIHAFTVNLYILTKQVPCGNFLILQWNEIIAFSLSWLQVVLFCSKIFYAVFDSCKLVTKRSSVSFA